MIQLKQPFVRNVIFSALAVIAATIVIASIEVLFVPRATPYYSTISNNRLSKQQIIIEQRKDYVPPTDSRTSTD